MTVFKIDELLPHAGKMVLLERVVEFDENHMIAEVIVRNDGLYGDENSVPAWLGIEYMAQTIAALGGMKRRIAEKPINPGFLLGTRRYDCNIDAFAVGSVLTVSVKCLIQEQGLGVFDCRIEGPGVYISANLNVYHPDDALDLAMTS